MTSFVVMVRLAIFRNRSSAEGPPVRLPYHWVVQKSDIPVLILR